VLVCAYAHTGSSAPAASPSAKERVTMFVIP
jgi:hypothetical protein